MCESDSKSSTSSFLVLPKNLDFSDLKPKRSCSPSTPQNDNDAPFPGVDSGGSLNFDALIFMSISVLHT